MSIAFARKLQDLAQRVEVTEQRLNDLEREQIASERRRFSGLRAQADSRRAAGEALKTEVRAILQAHAGLRRLKAYSVRSFLTREQLPSLRRVQELMREIKRETGGTAHDVVEHSATRAA